MAYGRSGRSSGRRGCRPTKARLIIALVIAAVALGSYFLNSSNNPITGNPQRVSLTPQQEIALGLQAVPQMIAQYKGESPDTADQRRLDEIGGKLTAALRRLEGVDDLVYPFEFTLLADDQTINAFALPGGQTFITEALYEKLATEGQVAGVMAHEISHVVHRHGAQQMAKLELTQGLAGAATIAAGDAQGGQLAAAIGQMVNMKYGRDDEIESDTYGVAIMAEAGYDPRSMIDVMKVLAEAGGSGRQPEFFSTHPNPDNRIERIEETIRNVFPNGVPEGLVR